jgi:hypothetical protein
LLRAQNAKTQTTIITLNLKCWLNPNMVKRVLIFMISKFKKPTYAKKKACVTFALFLKFGGGAKQGRKVGGKVRTEMCMCPRK